MIVHYVDDLDAKLYMMVSSPCEQTGPGATAKTIPGFRFAGFMFTGR